MDNQSRPEDLKAMQVESLSRLQDWMIPPSRRKEVEEYRASERRRQIKESDKRAQETRGTKPGERFRDPRGYYHPEDRYPRKDAEEQDRSTEQPRKSSPPQCLKQKRLNELRAILKDRLHRIEVEQKATIQEPASSKPEPAQRSNEAYKPRAYVDGIGWMSVVELSDLILSEEFTTLDEHRKSSAVSMLLELDEDISDHAWKLLERRAEPSEN